MVKRILLSSLAGAVVISLLASFFFGFLLADFFASSLPADLAGVSRQTPNFGLIVVADFLYAIMLAFVLDSLAGTKTFRRGATVGMIIGFAVMLHFDLISHATTRLNTPATIAVNVVVSTFMSALAAGVIAAVLGRLESASQSAGEREAE